jgi:hypothetical protein
MKCRHCRKILLHTFLDLGFAPPSNAYLNLDDLHKPEIYYPLTIKVCSFCWLVQTEDYAQSNELFSSDYAYFSSTSSSWLRHAANYTREIIPKLNLTNQSFVIEVASNDGYLLKNFVDIGIPCLGIEPTASTAEAAEKIGIPVCREFFGEKFGQILMETDRQADLIIGNNVYAHVPDINDFTRGLKLALKPGGAITLEFPHLLRLLEQVQFDTVYHEHFSYLSLFTVSQIFKSCGLRVYDVEPLSTHGGSLRIYGCHENDERQATPNVERVLSFEAQAGLQKLDVYKSFQHKADAIKDALLLFLIDQKKKGKKVAAYGAAAKGNTLLNYAGVKSDLLPFVCDAAPAKQHKYMPGSHISIMPPDELMLHHIDYLIVLPWNIANEVREQLGWLSNKGTRFVTAVPILTID